MNSPLVRCSRIVRSPLTLAALGVCTLWGCQHIPGSHRWSWHGDAAVSELPSEPAIEPAPVVKIADPYDEPPIPAVEKPQPIVSEQTESTTAADDSFGPEPRRTSAPIAVPVPQSQPTKTLPNADEEEPIPLIELFRRPIRTEVPPEPAAPTETLPGELKQPATTPATEAISLPVNESSESSRNEQRTAKPSITVVNLFERPASITTISSSRSALEIPADDRAVLTFDAHCEGITFDALGFGYVSRRGQIVRFSPTGETSLWITLDNPKGHCIEPEGTHLVCDSARQAVVRLSYDGKLIGIAASECNGNRLQAPYDVAVDPRGGFYFTDSGFVQSDRALGKLHYVDRSGRVSQLAAKIGYPTGLVFDAAGQRLLVAESQFNRVLEFQVNEPGQIEAHRVFAQLPSKSEGDYHLGGLCLDSDGNVYVTQPQQRVIQVIDPQGRSLGRFATGSVSPSSVALRSPDAEELFVTGQVQGRAGQVLRLQLGSE